jgi:hypothetical protein
LLTIKVTGLTWMSVFNMAKTRVWPLTWPPVNEAIAVPTGPSSSPIMTSGSAAVPGGPPATKASPVRITILSLILDSS